MSDVLVLDHAAVRRLLPMATCMDLMEGALRTLARGDATNPLRWGMRLPDGLGILGLMPGLLGADGEGPAALGLKVVSIFPGNEGTPYDSHQGVVVLFHPRRGYPIAVLDAAEITAIRTAAVSGVATRLLARPEASRLGLLGSGVQARTHLEAMRAARPIAEVRVWSPDVRRRTAFAEREGERHGMAIAACDSAEEACRGAEIICTVTAARQPILRGEWLAEGCHVNAVGASIAEARELDAEAVRRSRLFVDRRESAVHEAGDFLLAKAEGVVDDDHIVGEIGDLLLGAIDGRTSEGEITLFKSLGLAVEDLAVGRYLLERARAEGVGTEVGIGWLPDDAG